MIHPNDPGEKPTEYNECWVAINDEIFTKETKGILSFSDFYSDVFNFCEKEQIMPTAIRLRIDDNNYYGPVLALEQMSLVKNSNFKSQLQDWEERKSKYDREMIGYNQYLKEEQEKEKIKKAIDLKEKIESFQKQLVELESK